MIDPVLYLVQYSIQELRGDAVSFSEKYLEYYYEQVSLTYLPLQSLVPAV